MNTNTEIKAAHRPALAFYHANGKGTGCAAKFELHPARHAVEGCISVLMANQVMGDPNANSPIYPRFDWDNAMAFNLYFTDVCEFLRVFRGETESVADGRGQFHRTPHANIRVHLRHVVEPVCCYSLEVYERRFSDSEERRVCIVLTSAEATGLCLALEQSMGLIAFGVPNA